MPGAKLGFVGLGTMGAPMVLNLLKKGFDVTVSSGHPNSSGVKLATANGAVSVEHPVEVARASDIVIMCLPKAEVSENVFFGDSGLLAGSRPGTIIVEMSTVPPSTVKKFGSAAKKKRVKVLDAPVSGGRPGAELGTLTIMVGGDEESFQRCKPIFEAVGKRIYHVGGLGAGETMKLVNGLIGNATLMAALEALDVASRSGLDLRFVQGVVSASTGQSWVWDNLVPKILDGKDLGVRLDILAKDVGYASSMADGVGTDAKITREVSSVIAELRQEVGMAVDLSSAFASMSRGRKRKAGRASHH
ncbi:MAG TPA: NAD(P)-dependent oxidoreductase [Nitrososphaerales archaeon]|nr:NAD(P)-dependent oxidoreductase [Nitrososphaerales archaeon]